MGLLDAAGIGRVIRDARDRCGLTQSQLAERLGTHQSRVHYWEKGAHPPPRDDLPKIAEVLGLTVEQLILDPEPQAAQG